MSDALKTQTFRAKLHPAVIAAAQAIGQSKGWHMSNAYRPACPNTRTHNLGISLDVAPLSYTRGGFWLKTAATILAFVQQQTGRRGWAAVSELDHVHLSLSNVPAIGYNSNGRTFLYSPETKEGLQIMSMNNNGLTLSSLPDGPMGDLEGDILHGDAVLSAGDLGAGDLRMGDLTLGDVLLDAGDVDPRLLDLTQSGDMRTRARAVNKINDLPKTQKSVLITNAILKQHRNSASVPYYLVTKGASVRQSSIGTSSRMSAAECALIRDDLFNIPQATPIVSTLPLVGSSFVLNLNAVLATLFPAIPVDSRVIRYVGSIITITANDLTRVPDIAANITIDLGEAQLATPFTASLQVQLAKNGDSTRVYVPTAVLSAARARLVRPLIKGDPSLVAPVATILTVSGIPTNYVVTHSFMQLEDTFTNEYTRLLPA